MKTNAPCYEDLRQYIETIPLIDCHDHTAACGPKYVDPIQIIATDHTYFLSDLTSASSESDMAKMLDFQIPLTDRWPILEKAWKRACHTGYAQVTKRVLKKFFNEDQLTLPALQRIADKLPDLEDEKLFDDILGQANIAVRLENVFYGPTAIEEVTGWIKSVLNGTLKLTPRARLVIPLVLFHHITSYNDIHVIASALDRTVTSLDEFLDCCMEIFEGYKEFGAVAFKDQSAYTRSLNYTNPTRAQAEQVFNFITADHRRIAGYPEQIKPLDDFLFHEFMRMARDLELPVQLHTGHMANIRNDIVKTNAVHLTSVLELHREVKFDLFHANWPYSAELLFLAKNYPNVAIDFCWTNIIDPLYCQNLFKQILSAVPHGKVHGFGSDFSGHAHRAWAHADIARENIAIALADMVTTEYLSLDEAKQVAHDWLFENANKSFNLNLT